MSQPIPELGECIHIQLYQPSSAEIRDSSVLKIEHVDDLLSDKLGVSEWSQSCGTCDCYLDECPGHPGHLELPIPCYRVFFVKDLIQYLNCICFYCQRLRLPTTSRHYHKVKHMESKYRLAYLANVSKSIRFCGNESDLPAHEEMTTAELAALTQHQGCGKAHVMFKQEDKNYTFIRPVVRLDDRDAARFKENPLTWQPVAIGPQEIFDTLSVLSPEVKHMLGCDEFNDPLSCMWDVLPVPSVNTRPMHTFSGLAGGKKRMFNDATKFLRSITGFAHELRQMMKETTEKVNCAHYIYGDIESLDYRVCFNLKEQFKTSTKENRDKAKKDLKNQLKKVNFGGMENVWRNLNKYIAGFHSEKHSKLIQRGSYTRRLNSIETVFKGQKKGRFRSAVEGRRLDDSGRGVLEGSMSQKIDQVGIPRKEAMNLCVKVYVNVYNIQKAQRWILNGPLVYPGANYVTMINGDELNLSFFENRRDIDVTQVLYVSRHIMDDDMLIVGRHPTLHRLSMVTCRAKVIEGFALRLHYALFPGMGADCDGDEIYFFVLQNIQASAEAVGISSVKENVMRDGKVWIRFIINAVVGAYLMTRKALPLEPAEVSDLVSCLELSEWPDLRRPWTTHEVVSLLFPPDFTVVNPKLEIRHGRLIRGTLDDQTLNGYDGILHHLYRDYADKQMTMQFIWRGYILFQKFLDLCGNSAGFYDCAFEIPSESQDPFMQGVKDRMSQLHASVQRMYKYVDQMPVNSPQFTSEKVESNIRDHTDALSKTSMDLVYEYHQERERRASETSSRGAAQNGLLAMIESGAKGSKNTLNQMCGMVGQVTVMYRRFPYKTSHVIPGVHDMASYGFVAENYSSGISLMHLVSEAHAACESVLQKNRGVSTSGYTIRKLAYGMMGNVVNYHQHVETPDGRILWSVYGHDNYDAQTLTMVKNRIMDAAYWLKWQAFDPIRDWSGADDLEGQVAADWLLWKLCRVNDWAQEKFDMQEREHHLRTWLERCNDREDNARARLPFDFQHLFDRMPAAQPEGRRWIHPGHYLTRAKELWQHLLDHKLVVSQNLVLETVFFDWFSVKNQCEYRLSWDQLDWLRNEIVRLLGRCLVQPGESVGLLATQNMGEPFAQMALKSPHNSGKFTQLVAGTERIANIINANFAHPQMTIRLDPEHVKSRVDAEIFGASLVECYLHSICQQYPNVQISPGSASVEITILLHREKAIDKVISLRHVIRQLSHASGIPLTMFSCPEQTQPRWFINIRIPLRSDVWVRLESMFENSTHAAASTLVYNLMYNVLIHGVAGLEHFVVDEYGPTSWGISTLGSNLRYVLAQPQVDARRTISNDVSEMCQILGVLAARQAVENELFLMMGNGLVDTRHIKMVARVMASDMVIKGFRINQIANKLPPLERAAYEKTTTQMQTYCSLREVDDGKTLCGAVLMNKRIGVGTGYNLAVYPSIAEERAIRPPPLQQYVFSPKADGTRYFLVCYGGGGGTGQTEPFIGLVNRECKLHTWILSDPKWKDCPLLQGTVLDGELCRLPNSDEYVFLIFDALLCAGNKCSTLRYDQRLEIAREVLYRLGTWINPLLQKTPFPMGAHLPFTVPIGARRVVSENRIRLSGLPEHLGFAVKPVFDMTGFRHYHEHMLTRLPFRHDGVVFTNLFLPAYPFRMRPESVFKWKPQYENESENTIDMVCIPYNEWSFGRYGAQMQEPLAPRIAHLMGLDCTLSFEQVEQFRTSPPTQNNPLFLMLLDTPTTPLPFALAVSVDGMQSDSVECVYECAWNFQYRCWVMKRVRQKAANRVDTVLATLQNILENITPDEIATVANMTFAQRFVSVRA